MVVGMPAFGKQKRLIGFVIKRSYKHIILILLMVRDQVFIVPPVQFHLIKNGGTLFCIMAQAFFFIIITRKQSITGTFTVGA